MPAQNDSVKPLSKLANPDQTWLNLPEIREMCSRPCLEVVSFCMPTPEKISRVKIGLGYFYNLYVKNQRQYKRWRTRWELRDLL